MRNASVRCRYLEGGILVEPWLEIRVTAGACLCPSCTSTRRLADVQTWLEIYYKLKH